MSDLNFIEYNVNPETHSIPDSEISIRALGFKQLSTSRCGKASMWVAGKCILLLSTREDTSTGLSGIGFNSDNCMDGSVKCTITGLNFCKFNGINVYSYPVELFRKNFEEYFDGTKSEIPSTLPLEFVSGITLENSSINVMNEFVEKLKFKIIKKSEHFVTSVCSNNRFHILWNNNADQTKIKKVVLTTSDIFGVLADYATMGFDLTTKHSSVDVEQFYSNVSAEDSHVPSKQKIKAYGLNIYGKSKSFVIEKQITSALPELDVIISQRFNHNGVNEESIISYEDKNLEQHLS